jgi:hypothetical protein
MCDGIFSRIQTSYENKKARSDYHESPAPRLSFLPSIAIHESCDGKVQQQQHSNTIHINRFLAVGRLPLPFYLFNIHL